MNISGYIGNGHQWQEFRDRIDYSLSGGYGQRRESYDGRNLGTSAVPSPEAVEAMNRCKVLPELLNYIRDTPFPYINDVANYERLAKIGQGTFGEVFKAKCKRTNRIVALKKILLENEKEGFPITALREVKMLQKLKHENITDLIEVCSSKTSSNPKDRSTFFLVFAFCDHDLAGLLSNRKIRFTVPHIKTLLKHLFNGLDKLHRTKIMHRDMKTANVLVSREGVLKLADFGLSRFHFGSDLSKAKHERRKNRYTNQVVTLWYRPPELLLGERDYTPAIDVWGAGCIMAELWTRSPILQGDTEQKQLELISQLCGSITTTDWPDVIHLPLWGKLELPAGIKRAVRNRLDPYVKDNYGLELIDSLLALDPWKRRSAKEALQHQYFFAHPHPQDNIKDLMDTITTSMFEYTAGRGAHAGKVAHQDGSKQQRPQVIPPGQFYDMVF